MTAPAVDARLPDGEVAELYRQMFLIRRFEERVSVLYRDGEIPGFVHISSGQEAVAVGACRSLRATDGVVSNHRGHGHCLAKGAPADAMMAELLGRATGTCRGLGGSMHIADVGRGVYGANGIVGAGLPIATGIAAAFQVQAADGVVVAFFGDGAVPQGAFHEAVNLAALWRLPVIFLCENNGYAEFSPFDRQHPVPVSARAPAYGIDFVPVDGNDVEAVATTLSDVVDRVRAGNGPVLVEAVTYRFHGHYEGDPERYRSSDEVSDRRRQDPLVRTRAELVARGVSESDLQAMEAGVEAELERAVEGARVAPVLDFEAARSAVVAERPVVDESPITGAPDYRVMDAVHDALEHALEDDGSVWLAGIDVESGNIFGLTRGLADRFGGRVRDTPISEVAIMGCGVGAAMAGSRPVVELMYLDFLGVCFDQLLNQAAKLRYMTGGTATLPLVVRTQFGAGRSSAAQHSQSLEALLAHIPGLSVVMPSTPADTYGLLRTAIEDPNPVIVIDNRLLYGSKGPRPGRDHRVPIGKGVIRRSGSDVTLVSWSRMVRDAAEAAERLSGQGIDVEVIDMRSVAPLDVDLVAESVERTGRLVVAHEAVLTGGVGAELVAQMTDRCFWNLDAPIRRVGAAPLPAPYAPALEAAWLPSVEGIEQVVREVARQ